MNAQIRSGIVKNAGQPEVVKPRFLSFENTKNEIVQKIILDNESINLHSQGKILVDIGDSVVVAGQLKGDKLNAWVYKNLDSGHEGGVYLKKRFPILSVLGFLASLFSIVMIGIMNYQTNHNLLAFLALILFLFIIIKSMSDLILIYLARKKYNKFIIGTG